MKNTYLIAGIVSTLLFFSAQAQENSLQLEVGGKSIIYTLQYERILLQKENFCIGLSAGVGALPLANHQFYSIPVSLIKITKQRNTKLEYFGGINFFRWNGWTQSETTEKSHQIMAHVGIGIRHNLGDKVFIKANITALSGILYSHTKGHMASDGNRQPPFSQTLIFKTPVMPMIGVGVGYKF